MITSFKKWISYILFDTKTKVTYSPELLLGVSEWLERSKTTFHNPSLPLKESTFVVFDTETTGFYPYAGDELISIGAILIKNGEIQEHQVFHEWINPYRSIPPIVRELTQVKEEELKEAPPALVVLYQFLQFIEGHYIVAHCADFDLNFINLQLKKHVKTKLQNPIIDTLSLSYYLNPLQSSHDLDYLLDLHHIPLLRRHHALDDAKMTAALFIKFLERLEKRGITTMTGLDHFIRSMKILHK
ncbi:PolC-type DNA polymerase III [Ammoniphilus sp. YIM 78166]|uniref:3'-5' exonuclease n=1 Tax=Ammoniphilus sp. YIM 78166 TaxID=1644106 RepID=UPI00106F474F|nr:exonuclease domain-containing protein [Ammoniphilus sp. YIM 78166]